MAENKKNAKGGSRSSSKNSKKGSDGSSGANEKRVKDMQDKRKADKKVIDEIWAITFTALGVFLMFCTLANAMGVFGNAVHDVLLGLFGWMAYVLPFYLIACALCLFFQKMQHINGRTVFFSLFIFINACMLNAYRFIDFNNLAYGIHDLANYYKLAIEGTNKGGAVGMELGSLVVKLIGGPGLIILCIALIIISLLLVINTPISKAIQVGLEKREAKRLMREMEEEEEALYTEPVGTVTTIPAELKKTPPVSAPQAEEAKPKGGQLTRLILGGEKEKAPEQPVVAPLPVDPKPREVLEVDEERRSRFVSSLDENQFNVKATPTSGFGLDGEPSSKHKGFGLDDHQPVSDVDTKSVDRVKEPAPKPAAPSAKSQDKAAATPTKDDVKAIADAVEQNKVKKEPQYVLPPYRLLNQPQGNKNRMSDAQLSAKADLLETTLANFNVDAKVVQVIQGSSVTRFEVKPAQGVKVSKIKSLSDDLALNMRAKSIRIEAPIPGKAAVGIEIENEKSNAVVIRELIESPEFKAAKSKISFAVGKDISGNNIIADLRGMPHLLIAGATGSGKSVCINTIITSILYKATPDEVRFVMIDPKVVELGTYNDIPHMLIPVVTDPKKAAAALSWSVNEMNQRYNRFAEEGVKDLTSYNEYMVANQEPDNVLPEIVIIIDELADLMMAASAQVQDSISRLTAKARAAGMHLIVATQRPSVDVVTGVIKANIPSRIAFSVSSQFDSRTILDMEIGRAPV